MAHLNAARRLGASLMLPGLVVGSGLTILATASDASAAVRTCPSDATNTRMPTSIRVLHTKTGRVTSVPFKTYVKDVLPNEWIASWPTESLHAGAMAVKTFAWYQVLHSTKRTRSGVCYHVADSTADQVYRPGSAVASTSRAVDVTWGERMTVNGQIFNAHYCATAHGCYYWRDGQWLSQTGSRDMARQKGMTHAVILKRYYRGLVIK